MKLVANCEDVFRVFNEGHANEVRALRGVDLQIQEGEMLAIAGPSGSGKTTLLNLIGCLDKPTKGEVHIAGEPISKKNRTELAQIRNMKLGFIFQSFHLIPVLTAYENVEFALQIQGHMTAAQRRERIMPLLETLGIAQLADRRPGQMSGGQQQRVAIARALVKRPVLILADEPTANLDSKTSLAIIEAMMTLNQDHQTTFVLSTHDPMVMEAVPRLVKLHDGKVIDDGHGNNPQSQADTQAADEAQASQEEGGSDVPA